MEVLNWGRTDASSRDPKGRVLGALQGGHVGAGKVRSPGQVGVFNHRPDKLLIKAHLLLLRVAVAEGARGHSPHHVKLGAAIGVDLRHLVAEGHATIKRDPKNLDGPIGWDWGAKEGEAGGGPVFS